MPVDKAKTARTHSKGVSELRLNSAEFVSDFLSEPQTWEGRPVPAKFARVPRASAQSRGTRLISRAPASERAARGTNGFRYHLRGLRRSTHTQSPLSVCNGQQASARLLCSSVQTLDNFHRGPLARDPTQNTANCLNSLTSRSICDKVIARWRSV